VLVLILSYRRQFPIFK